jgi:hypothetical protein
MTALLKKAFEKAATLPSTAQSQLAKQLLADIHAELQWDRTLATSQTLLERLAKQARAQNKAGRCRSIGFDEL